MSRRSVRFTQADVARCIRAAQQCGASLVLILPDGTIEIRLQPSEPSIDKKDRPKPPRQFGEGLGSYFQKPAPSPESILDPLGLAFDRFLRGEIKMNELPPGRYPNGMRVYADGEYEAIVRSRPLGKRERASLKAYFDADGAPDFRGGGPDTNEKLEIRGLIEKTGQKSPQHEPYFGITEAGKGEWLRLKNTGG
jgi:hypothetical protein